MATIVVKVPVDKQVLEFHADEAEQQIRRLAYQAACGLAGRPVTRLEEIRREDPFEGSPCTVVVFECQPVGLDQ